jgi:hypothetical protein
MGRKIKAIAITMEDVSFIFNNKLSEFLFLTAKSHCFHCQKGYDSTIVDYAIFLNALYDIELTGTCLECGNEMGRYIETGGDLETMPNAQAIWKTATTLKQLKIRIKKD